MKQMEETCVDKKVKDETREIISKYPKERDRLIAILNEIQEKSCVLNACQIL